MEKELMLQKGFDVVKLEDRCELVAAASADWSLASDYYERTAVAESSAQMLLY